MSFKGGAYNPSLLRACAEVCDGMAVGIDSVTGEGVQEKSFSVCSVADRSEGVVVFDVSLGSNGDASGVVAAHAGVSGEGSRVQFSGI